MSTISPPRPSNKHFQNAGSHLTIQTYILGRKDKEGGALLHILFDALVCLDLLKGPCSCIAVYMAFGQISVEGT